jgi:hypothetical protein
MCPVYRARRCSGCGWRSSRATALRKSPPQMPISRADPKRDYGVEAGEVAASPIDTLLDVQPERGFIQSKSRANTVEQGHQATDQKRRRLGSLTHFDQPAKSHCQQKYDAPDEVVDMRAANVSVMKRGDVAVSAVSHGARHRKRDEKSDGREEKPPLRPITHNASETDRRGTSSSGAGG